MRDPNRIPVLLQAIKEVWEKSPDLRLCQLIQCVTGKNDSFYVEDEEFSKQLIDFDNYLSELNNSKS